MTKRNRRTFTEEFKKQIVQLYEAGKSRKEIIHEYELTASSFDRWVANTRSGQSFVRGTGINPTKKRK